MPLAAVMAGIFYFSDQPGNVWALPVGWLDKPLHMAAYSGLAAAFLYGINPVAGRYPAGAVILLTVLFSVLYGLSDEYHQTFIPDRVFSLWDLAADGAGAALAAFSWAGRRSRAAAR